MKFEVLMNAQLAMALTVAVAICQDPAKTVSTSRCDGFPGVTAAPAALLELRLAEHGAAARLELRGGVPGGIARVAVGSDLASAEVGSGAFDANGCFALPVEVARFEGRTFLAQGFAASQRLDGSWTLQASNGLAMQVEAPVAPVDPIAPVPTPAPAPAESAVVDFSLLRIELDPAHGGAAIDRVVARDFVGALAVALNSHGDALLAKIGGKVMALVPGTPVQAGGSVTYSAKIARDGDEYLVAIGQEVAVLCGVKATANIGVEGGVSLGTDQIYRFASPGEVARGLFGIALQQALPGALDSLHGENLRKMRQLRARNAELVASLERLRSRRVFGGRALEAGLDALLGAVVRIHAHLRRVGDALDRVAGFLVDEAQFVRDHTDGVEARVATNCELSLKVGEKKLGGNVCAELGGKAAGGCLATVRTFEAYGEQPTRVEVLLATVGSGSFAAGVKLGSLAEGAERAYGRSFEISLKATRGLLTVFEPQGDGYGVTSNSIVIKREFGLCSFGRETTFAFDAAVLGTAGAEALFAVLDGEAAAALPVLGEIPVSISVQDKWTSALKPELGLENTGLTAKVSAEFSWADCGPARSTERTLAQVLERLLDAERTAAEVGELVAQVAALPAERL